MDQCTQCTLNSSPDRIMEQSITDAATPPLWLLWKFNAARKCVIQTKQCAQVHMHGNSQYYFLLIKVSPLQSPIDSPWKMSLKRKEVLPVFQFAKYWWKLNFLLCEYSLHLTCCAGRADLETNIEKGNDISFGTDACWSTCTRLLNILLKKNKKKKQKTRWSILRQPHQKLVHRFPKTVKT